MEKLLLSMLLFTVGLSTFAQNEAMENNGRSFLSVYPGYVVKKDKLVASKEFYLKWFGMSVIFESDWFILLVSPGEEGVPLALMSEDHPSAPPSSHFVTAASGVWITFQVADAKAEYERMKKEGAAFSYALRDEAWGQRRFGLTDPNGMYIDVVEQTEPQAGYWDKYMTGKK